MILAAILYEIIYCPSIVLRICTILIWIFMYNGILSFNFIRIYSYLQPWIFWNLLWSQLNNKHNSNKWHRCRLIVEELVLEVNILGGDLLVLTIDININLFEAWPLHNFVSFVTIFLKITSISAYNTNLCVWLSSLLLCNIVWLVYLILSIHIWLNIVDTWFVECWFEHCQWLWH